MPHPRTLRRLFLQLCLAPALIACGSSYDIDYLQDTYARLDADAADAGGDAAPETVADVESETAADATADAEPDAGADSEADSAPDSESDAAADADAETEADAAADAESDAAADTDAETAADADAASADADEAADADTAVDAAPEVSQPVCGNGTLEAGELCDDGNVVTEEPPDGTLPAGACIADCSIDMAACGDGDPTPASGEQCDDGNTDDEDACNSSCLVSDQQIGDACHAEDIGQDSPDYAGGTIVGCDNVPATFGGCERACLRSIDPGFSQPLVFNPGGYCTLLAISCSGTLCGFVPQIGDFDTCTACPEGTHLQETVTDGPGVTVTSRSCLKTCETQADCRWRQWDARFDEWGQYECLPSLADPLVKVCQDKRQWDASQP